MSTSSRTEYTDIRESRTPSPNQSFSELISKMAEDTSTLFRQEIALARAEMREDASSAAVVASMMAVAGALAAVALILLSFAAVEGLQRWLDIDIAWCFLIIGVVWAVVAAVLFAVGRAKLRHLNPAPERAVEEAKKIPETLKGTS